MPRARSVKKDVHGFCGWEFLLELVEAAPTAFMQGLMAALFGTGGRISEVLALCKWNIDTALHPDVVVIKQMPLHKRFEKVGEVAKWKCKDHCMKRWDKKPTPEVFAEHNIKKYKGWVTKPIIDQRTFPIRISEPLTKYLVSWCQEVKGPLDVLFPIKRSAAFVRIRNIGEELDQDIPFCDIRSPLVYLHWFRAERACQLAFDYGFDREDMNEFFQWKERRQSMAERYASLGWIGLARKMGVQV